VYLSFLFVGGCMTVTESSNKSIESNAIEKAEARITLGLGYLENGNMAKAKENIEKALEHAPEYYRAMISLAHYYDVVGETEQAHEAYEDALDEHDDNGHVLNNYGAFLCKIGEYNEADELFNEAVKQDNYYLLSSSYENAGLCAVKYRNFTKAKQYFTRAIEHDPQRTRSILHLAKLEIESGNFSQARIRLIQYQRDFGHQKASLKLLMDLEKRAGNSLLEAKYHSLLSQVQ